MCPSSINKQIDGAKNERAAKGGSGSSLRFDQKVDSSQSLETLTLSANSARLAFDHETAIQFYGQALAKLYQNPTKIDLQVEFDLLAGRQTCYGLLCQYAEQQADLQKMKELALSLNDVPRQIRVVTNLVALHNILGNYVDSQHIAMIGLDLARQVGDRALEADCLTSLGTTYNAVGDYANTRACHAQALRIYRALKDTRGEALSLRRMGDCLKDMGQSSLVQQYIEQSYSIYLALGDPEGQAGCLNILGIVTKDQARARSYYEQSLLIFQTIGDRSWQAILYNNLGLVYWGLGLYAKARDYLEQAVQAVRKIQGRSSLASFLESLGRIYIELGKYAEAQQVLLEGRELSRSIGDRLAETTYLMMLGRVALASGHAQQASEYFLQACEMQRGMGTQGYLVTSLAWLGAAHLQLDELDTANRYTLEAIQQLESVGRASEYPTQDVWWLHYQVLKAAQTANPGLSAPTLLNGDADLGDEAFSCLMRARDAMMAGIATLSDEGLRRNYLNKVKINRDILFESVIVSNRHKSPGKLPASEPAARVSQGFSPEPGRPQDRLKRLLDISLQMNATLNPDTLLDFVMDNVIELSGAERGFLVLVKESGELDFKVMRGTGDDGVIPTPLLGLHDPAGMASPESSALLAKVIRTKTPVLFEYGASENSGQAGIGDTAATGLALLDQRSAMCLPLLRRSELIGMIYVDNRSVSGRFSQADVDLLSVFANQAATAIENARLFRERERRITELSILDEISRSLSSTLTLDELLETVHQQVARIFDVTNFYIATYHEGDTEWVAVLQVDHGQRQPVVRHELGLGLTGYILRSRKPILLHSSEESKIFKEMQGIPRVGDLACSWMGMPLTTGDKVVGVMAIQSYEHENLYDDHALSLFSTISSQVAIAIRNTRLYDEKSRANQELESFSYSVSHDLRAPIRAINGFTHILLDEYSDRLDAEGLKHLHRVYDAGLRMGELIDDILRLSRVTRSEIRRTPVDLSQLAVSVTAELQNAYKGRQVEVVIAPDLKVNADSNLMRIVLENLLGNAWKFTQKHATARIELGVTEKDNLVTYFVRDDGAGFDEAYVNKLFGAFQRLHDAQDFEGTGIGLATVQRIVHRHGGKVWAEGVVEHGATFYFTLPA